MPFVHSSTPARPSDFRSQARERMLAEREQVRSWFADVAGRESKVPEVVGVASASELIPER